MAKKSNPLKYFNDAHEARVKKFQPGGNIPGLQVIEIPAYAPPLSKDERKEMERRRKMQKKEVRKGRRRTNEGHGDVRIFD